MALFGNFRKKKNTDRLGPQVSPVLTAALDAVDWRELTDSEVSGHGTCSYSITSTRCTF